VVLLTVQKWIVLVFAGNVNNFDDFFVFFEKILVELPARRFWRRLRQKAGRKVTPAREERTREDSARPSEARLTPPARPMTPARRTRYWCVSIAAKPPEECHGSSVTGYFRTDSGKICR